MRTRTRRGGVDPVSSWSQVGSLEPELESWDYPLTANYPRVATRWNPIIPLPGWRQVGSMEPEVDSWGYPITPSNRYLMQSTGDELFQGYFTTAGHGRARGRGGIGRGRGRGGHHPMSQEDHIVFSHMFGDDDDDSSNSNVGDGAESLGDTSSENELTSVAVVNEMLMTSMTEREAKKDSGSGTGNNVPGGSSPRGPNAKKNKKGKQSEKKDEKEPPAAKPAEEPKEELPSTFRYVHVDIV